MLGSRPEIPVTEVPAVLPCFPALFPRSCHIHVMHKSGVSSGDTPAASSGDSKLPMVFSVSNFSGPIKELSKRQWCFNSTAKCDGR
jgi:hypothetical protein